LILERRHWYMYMKDNEVLTDVLNYILIVQTVPREENRVQYMKESNPSTNKFFFRKRKKNKNWHTCARRKDLAPVSFCGG